MNRKKIYSSAWVLLGAGAGIAGAVWCGKHYKKARSRYQQACFYMAALDDEICRKELDGMVVAEKMISFPPRRETLYHRYEVFREMYRDLSLEELEVQVAKLEKCLAEGKEKGAWQEVNAHLLPCPFGMLTISPAPVRPDRLSASP